MRRRKPHTSQNLQPLTPDKLVLTQMARLGDNGAQARDVDFYLYLPNKDAAESVRRQLLREGFTADTFPPTVGSKWLCLATAHIQPGIRELHALRSQLSTLASDLGGEYDGWETQVLNGARGKP